MIRMICALLLASLVACAAETEPLGAPGFVPSASQPVGYRGDGNGCFPGAATVLQWWDGTPYVKEVDLVDRWGRPYKDSVTFLADSIAQNIVWKTEMPAWGNTQPIVVGDRIFTLGEPDYLFCVDARTGKLRWQRQLNAWALAGVEPKTAERCRELWDIYLAVQSTMGWEWHFNTCGRYMSREEFQPVADTFIDTCLPRILAKLRELDPEGQYDEPAARTVEGMRAFLADFKPRGEGYEGRVQHLYRYIGQRIDAIAGQKVKRDFNWGNMVGLGMNAPCSDGEHVYATFGQGQVACFTMDGTLVWGTVMEGPQANTSHIISPVLSGDILVDTFGHPTMRGLDKQTGKIAWEAKIDPPRKGGGYYIASHKVVTLPVGEDTMDVLVTSPGTIIRIRDGKVLGNLPYADRPYGGCSILVGGNIVIKGATGDNYNGPLEAYRLTANTADDLQIETIWRYPAGSSAGYEPQAIVGDLLYWNGGPGRVYDLATGKVIVGKTMLGQVSNLATGNGYYWSSDGSQGWNQRRPDGTQLQRFYAADIINPSAPRLYSQMNWLGVSTAPRFPALEKHVPELYANPNFYNGAGGKPGQFAHADTFMTAKGNRLFLRSCAHLYCIGDPAAPFDGIAQPVGDPLLDTPTAAKLDEIVAKLSAADRPTQLAAARALRMLGDDAAPATMRLVTLFTSDDDAHAEAGYLGLRALGTHAAPDAAAVLVAAGKGGGAMRTRILPILGGLGVPAVHAAEAMLGDASTYPYAIEILANATGADEARAIALGTAIVNSGAGRGYASVAYREHPEQAWIIAGELLAAMGPAGKAAGPLLQPLPANRRDTRELLRISDILSSIAPELCGDRLPDLLRATRENADNQWDYGRPLTILRRLGAGAQSALPELQPIQNEGTGRPEFRQMLQDVIQELGAAAGNVWITELSSTPALVLPGDPVTIAWKTVNATGVTLKGAGAVAMQGSATVAPRESADYTLTASGPGGPVTRTLHVRVLAPRGPVTVANAQPGLTATYYALQGADGSLPNFAALTVLKTGEVDRLQWPQGNEGFATSGRGEQVAAVFTGYLDVPRDGLYTFYTESDDGSSLAIGDDLIVSNDGAHGMQEAEGAIALKAGKHPITVRYAQGAGGYGLIVRWAGPGMEKAEVPGTALWHGEGALNQKGAGPAGGGNDGSIEAVTGRLSSPERSC